MNPLRIRPVLLSICILLLTACQPSPPPAAAPGGSAITAPVSEPQIEVTVDPVLETLQRIEAGGRAVRVFTASVAVERTEPLFDKRDVRRGDVLYEKQDGATPRFAVHLEQRQVGRRLENRPKRILFDGRWLTEIDEPKKQVIRWELCGDEVDPTRLGGRFPLPVGQPAADVLARYHVELIGDASRSEFLTPAFEDRTVVGLRIVPRDDVPTADDFKHVDLWYDTANWLPVGVAMVDEEGNTRRLRLADARVNPELDEEQRRRLAGTVPTTADWVVDERRCPEDVEPAGDGE